jgi:hypothetical protein
MDELRVPDVIGEIIGWRAWRVIGDRPEKLPMLASATFGNTIWHPGYWTVATCGGNEECNRSNDGRVPGELCSCGLYCAKDRAQLVGLPYGRQDGRRPKIVGEVAMVGKVIPGSQGWRGEKGRIARLYVPFEFWRLVTPLEELYHVEVLLDNTRKREQTRIGGGD